MTFDNEYSGTTHETRLLSKGQQSFDWIVGLYHTKQNSNLRFSEVLPGMDAWINRPGGVGKAQASPLPDVGYSEDLGSRYSEWALFGEGTLKLSRDWKLNFGARGFNYKDTARAEIIDYAGGVVDNRFVNSNGENGNSYIKINTSYQVTPEVLAYFTYSEGFRRGGTNGFRETASRPLTAEAKEYLPDSTENYEIGLKGYLLNRQLYLETSIYQIDWKNTQTYRQQDISGFPVNGTANGPDAQSKGFEISSRWKISNAWQLSYSAATTEAKWTSTKTHCLNVSAAGVLSNCRTWNAGGLLGGAPKWKHNVGVRFQLTLPGDYFFSASLSARYVGNIQVDRSDTPADNATLARYQSYTRYGASASLGKDSWDAQLWISNLTNLKRVVSSQAAGIMGPRDIFMQPRTIGVNLSYRFD